MEIGLVRQSSDSSVRITSIENDKRKVKHNVLELKYRVVSSSRKAKAITSELELQCTKQKQLLIITFIMTILRRSLLYD